MNGTSIYSSQNKINIDRFLFSFDTVQKLEQTFIMTPSISRDAHLVWLLKNLESAKKSVIIFTGKCRTCELLRVMLRELEINTTAMHSQMSQQQRIASLAKFRSGLVPILLTTDVGSRYDFKLVHHLVFD